MTLALPTRETFRPGGRIRRPSDAEVCRAAGFGHALAHSLPPRANSVLPLAPSAIAGLIYELRADVPATYVLVSGALSSWTDTGPSALVHTQATASKRATYNATGLNGKPTFTHVRASSQSVSANTALWTGDPAFTVFCVGSLSDTTNSAFLSIGVTTGNAFETFVLNHGAPGRMGMASNHTATFESFIPVNTPTVAVMSKAAGADVITISAYRNGALVPLAVQVPGTNSVNAGKTTVGENIRSLGTTYAFGGNLSHVGAFSRQLSYGEVLSLTMGLTQQWGIVP